MAKDYEINLKVNTGSSVNDLNDLESSLSGINEELIPLTSQMGEIEDKLMLMAYAGDTTSEEFKKLSLEVAGMRKTIRETDAGLEALSLTTAQKLGGALGGVTSGFETVQGVMGAFGVESEEVEKALLKVQSAMAIAQGVQGIKEAIPSIKAFGSGAITAFKGMTTAGKAFALTGIGLIITLLAEAVSAMDFFSDSTEEAEKKQKALEKQLADTTQQLELQKEASDALASIQTDNLDAALNAAIRAGASEKELARIRKQASQDRIDQLKTEEEVLRKQYLEASKNASTETYEAVLKAYNESVRARKDAQQALDDLTTQEIQAQREAAQEAAEARKDAINEWKDAQKAALEEINAANYEYLNSKKSAEEQEVIAANDKWDELIANAKKYKLDNTQLLLNKEEEEKAIRKKYADEVIALEKEKQDALNLLIKQAADENLQAREDFDALLYEATTSAQQQELDLIGEKYFYLIEMAKQYGLDTTQLEADRLTKEAEINAKYSEEKKAANQQILDDQKAAIQAENELRIQAATDTFTTLGDLTTLFAGKSEKAQKRAFEVQKAVSIAQAVIDTYKAANVALASSPPPFNYIAMAAAITTGLVNVKTIMAQKFEGAGTSGGGTTSPSSAGGGTTNVMTPNFNVVGNSGINQLAQVAGQPIQAYVVSGQITTAQSLDRNKIENATL